MHAKVSLVAERTKHGIGDSADPQLQRVAIVYQTGDLPAYLEKLSSTSTPVALISFGSPYLLAGFPKVAAYIAAFSTATPSEVSVAKALLGEIPITGHMPVTIPDFAQYGDGIQLPAKTQSAPSAN